MFEAELVTNTPCCWIREIMCKYPASVNIIDIKALEDGVGIQELFEIDASPDSLGKVMRDIGDNVYEAEFIQPKNGRIYGVAKVPGRPMCMSFIESTCFFVSARARYDGRVHWIVRGTGNALRDLTERLEREGIKVDIKRFSSLEDDKPLTPRQQSVLEAAMEQGYFEFPRMISLHGLAKGLGIKPASLSEILRRGQKKALREYLRSLRSKASCRK